MNNKNGLVFVVDDDSSVRESLNNLIRSAGRNVQTFSSAQEFLASQRPKTASCLVLDLQLPGLSGLDLQQELAKAGIQIPIIFVTGHGDIPTSVRAIKAGALEFLTKPINDEDLLDAIQQAIARDQQARQSLGESGAHNFGEIVGRSPALAEVLKQVEVVAPTESTVLILGETGTGKELIARAVHTISSRSKPVRPSSEWLPSATILLSIKGSKSVVPLGALSRARSALSSFRSCAARVSGCVSDAYQ